MSVVPVNYSFSGSDARVFVYFKDYPHLIQPLDSVHTISISVHEAKGAARAVGYRGIKGIARGVRTIAGSLILTVINDHPLRVLQEQYLDIVRSRGGRHIPVGWSLDRNYVGVGTMANSYNLSSRMPVILPPFNLGLQYVSEGRNSLIEGQMTATAHGAGALIVGMEFIDDGLVTSTNDIVSEMTFSWIARDYKPLASFDLKNVANITQFENQNERDHAELMNRIRRKMGITGSEPLGFAVDPIPVINWEDL